MRLIDADALMELSMYEFWQDCSAITSIGEYILSKFRNLIRSMPTIEPVRKKGKWILTDFLDEDTYMCSVCQARIDSMDKFRSYFCYHCGSDMRGEE